MEWERHKPGPTGSPPAPPSGIAPISPPAGLSPGVCVQYPASGRGCWDRHKDRGERETGCPRFFSPYRAEDEIVWWAVEVGRSWAFRLQVRKIHLDDGLERPPLLFGGLRQVKISLNLEEHRGFKSGGSFLCFLHEAFKAPIFFILLIPTLRLGGLSIPPSRPPVSPLSPNCVSVKNSQHGTRRGRGRLG